MIYLKEGKTPLNFAYNDEIVHDGNSTYQLSFKFPTNNPLWEELVEETLLLADDLHGEQEFIIFEVEKHHAYITVHANQVATLLNNYSITELSVNNASGDRVMRSLVGSIIRDHKFTFSSDIASTHNINLKNVTVATALFKDKHSILGQWGGDLIRDKYDIRLLSNGGTNKEALFMYKKNLKSYQQKKSIKDLRTRIHFTKTISSQKEGEKDKVIAVTVDSPLISKYKNIYEGNLDVSDQDVIDEVTLRKYGEQYFKTTLCDVIEESIEIDVVGNPDVPVNIFDTVTVFHEKFNLDVKKKITKYTYTPMGRKLKTIGFGKIQQGLGTTLANMIDDAVTEHVESKVDAFKIQKNLSELLKLDRKGIEDKLVELEERSNSALEVKRALFEEDGNIPDIVKTKILDAVEAEIGRLKTIITEAELIKAIQAKLNYAEIKNTLIDKAFINQIISDEKFTQQFEDGEVNTQNIFTKLKDSIKSNISKDFVTKEGVKKLVNDLTIDADGIRQITQQESEKVFNASINGKVQEIVGEVKKNLPTKEELKGKSSYLYKKYSDFADGRNMSDNSTLKYIGIYTGDKQQAPTNASEYSWTKIRGEDGNNGRDGVSNYIHRKYSDYSNGANMSDNSSLKYIGIYTGTSATPPTTASSYLWSKIKGEDGSNGTPGVKGADGRTPYFHTAYSNSPTGDRDFSTTNSTDKQYIGTYSDFEVADSTDYRKYKWVKIKGENGRDGVDGKDGDIGLNLLKGTKEFDTSYFAPPDAFQRSLVWIDETERYEDFAVKSTIYQFNGLWQNVKVEQGKTYEFGFFAKGSRDTGRIVFSPGWPSSSAKQPLAKYNVDTVPFKLTTDWKFYSFRFTVTGTGWSQCRVEKNEDNNGIKLSMCGMYLKEVKNNQQTPLKWSPSIEDLQAHSLTANVRFEGTYINSITNNVKIFAEVYYDGQRVTNGYNLKIKHKGGNNTQWGAFYTKNYTEQGEILQYDWGNKEQNGTPLEVIVLIDYKGLTAIASERLENVPDVTEIKETIRKYKTFDSTLERFNSTIGEVKQQIVNGNRNYIKNSGTLSDVNFGGANWEKTVQNGTIVLTKLRTTDDAGIALQLMPFLKDTLQNETVTWSMDIKASKNISFNRAGQETNGMKGRIDITTQWQRISHTFTNRFTQWYSFVFYGMIGTCSPGDKIYIRFPKLEKGNVATEWTVAPEDVSLLKETTETSIEQTNRNLELKVSKDDVIASINASVEKNEQGENQGIVKIRGEVIADNIHGKTFTGSKFEVGRSGFLDSQGNNLRISAPHDWGGSSGVGMQLRGKTEGEFNQGLNIYRVNDVRNPNTPLYTPDETALTVFGEIRGAFKINSRPRSGTLKSRMGVAVMSNVERDNPTVADGYYGASLYSIRSIYLRSGGGPTQLWVNDGTGSNATYGVNLANMESDIKLKENISISNHSGLDVINKFTFHSFDWKEDKFGYSKPHTKIGLIAQEVQEIQEDLVYKNPNALALDEFRLLNISLKAIQELSEENTNLKLQFKEMNERLTKLEELINGKL